ncbi:restriction endonuclease [Patescibacteria group bacterium]
MKILKTSGQKEKYDKSKLRRSLIRSGLSQRQANNIVTRITKNIPAESSTDFIFKNAQRELIKEDPVTAYRYNLKRAITELGPTGFPFEQLISRILNAHGYSTRVDVMVNGYCVQHEVDVIAKKDNREILVESKFHNRPGTKTDVGVLLYSHARFQDIIKARNKNKFTRHEGWVVTNTQFTTQALKFSRCSGTKAVSWSHPTGSGLKELIESKGIYPVTVIPQLSAADKQRLFKANIVLLSDFIKYPPNRLAKIIQININRIKYFQAIAKDLTV